MDTVDGLPKYWVRDTWLPGKGPEEDYSLYRVHEVEAADKGYSITSDPTRHYKKVWFTQIGIIHNFHSNETFTPADNPWLDHGPYEWFVNTYEPYGRNDESQKALIALAELAQVK